jgi:hypothetical protein
MAGWPAAPLLLGTLLLVPLAEPARAVPLGAGSATGELPWQAAAAHRAWEHRPPDIGRDASTLGTPVKAPLGAAYIGHPLAPAAQEQRQQIIDALLVGIKVCLICLAVTVCCLLRVSRHLQGMKNVIAHRLWKRR